MGFDVSGRALIVCGRALIFCGRAFIWWGGGGSDLLWGALILCWGSLILFGGTDFLGDFDLFITRSCLCYIHSLSVFVVIMFAILC